MRHNTIKIPKTMNPLKSIEEAIGRYETRSNEIIELAFTGKSFELCLILLQAYSFPFVAFLMLCDSSGLWGIVGLLSLAISIVSIRPFIISLMCLIALLFDRFGNKKQATLQEYHS